ncbi:MAG: serine/threonine protein kinase [Planctomycetes bacterium]|nr:serine/threonine protein kinase [Planctomycetota bacterium]
MENPTPAVDRLAADEIDWTGQVLGQFRILHRLGRGGMGQVYLAEQTNLKRKVALKLLNPELAGNERALARFKAEAENVARATHANIVQVYDIGKDNGVNWLALEYVEGKNLREFIEKKGTPDIALGLHIMAQVASALQRAGELGIIHRDIKPENILLNKKGEVKVADFGLSRCFETDDQQQSITQSQVTMGTPLYMSPEQVERKAVDTRTDIYSFGVTCYHMFAGTPPFKGNSPIEVAYQHVHKEPEPLRAIRPDLPPALCAIIQKMMAKKPDERYQSAREILRDITQIREALNLGTIASISISSSFVGPAPAQSRSTPIVDRSAQPSWIVPTLAGLSVLIALTGGVAFGWIMNRPDNPPIKEVTPPNPNPPPIEPPVNKKPIVSKEDEKEMQRLVQKYLDPTNESEMITGLQHSVELGLYYLKAKRLDEAEKLFAELRDPGRKVAAYRMLGRIGQAMTLAFKDQPAASIKEFLPLIEQIEKIEAKVGPGFAFKPSKKDPPALEDEREAYKRVWKLNAPIREMVARALDHNFINNPSAFAEKQPAEKLNAYRTPPRPTIKGPPPMP